MRSGRTATSDTPPLRNALDLLEHTHKIGGGGIQASLRGLQAEQLSQLHEKAGQWGMSLEGMTGLPRTEADVERFDVDLKAARDIGVTVFRVGIGGRRYEDFDTAEGFRAFRERSWKSITLAEPIARKHGVKLAIENHKDWRVPDLLDILRRISSPHVGVTLDTGNSIALLEDPMEVARAFAPFALATHIKDMAVEECDTGFLLSEVPLGEGFLDLKAIIDLCLKANPAIQFSLEMMTRDPLLVPCLTKKYWATFDDVPAQALAETLRCVRENKPKQPLPRITGKSLAEQIAFEEENNRRCLAYAREKLGL
jgi:sugar phosphate isomerase/epimerase